MAPLLSIAIALATTVACLYSVTPSLQAVISSVTRKRFLENSHAQRLFDDQEILDLKDYIFFHSLKIAGSLALTGLIVNALL